MMETTRRVVRHCDKSLKMYLHLKMPLLGSRLFNCRRLHYLCLSRSLSNCSISNCNNSSTALSLSSSWGRASHSPRNRNNFSSLFTNPRRSFTNRNLLSLRERGLISDIFPDKENNFKNLCNAHPQTVYAGFDPTADSLHVGNLAILMVLLHCQRGGHNPIALIGGATGMIGDPSGKNTERPALEAEVVDVNARKLAKNIMTVFQNHADLFWDDKQGHEPLAQCLVVNNLDWYNKMSSIQFFNKLGRHFRVGQMLSKQSVQSRMNSEDGISFTEFSYQVFQAYDWFQLFTTHKCLIQAGGNDQMGNIKAGHDFISRKVKKQVYGITVPLITSETGDKYGKSAGNAVWLDPVKTSPFEIYQFFVRTPDADVERLLKIFTFRTLDEITVIIRKHFQSPDKRYAQMTLASDVTRLVHGEVGYENAINATKALYSEDVNALASIPTRQIDQMFKGTRTSFSDVYLEPGTTILSMALKAKCFDTEKDAMRIINAGGFSLNYRKISNFDEMVVPGIHILPNKISLARVGKKNYYVIRWSP